MDWMVCFLYFKSEEVGILFLNIHSKFFAALKGEDYFSDILVIF